MPTPEYKCQDCSMEFTPGETPGQEMTSEPKCPVCKGNKVRKLTGAEILARLALGSMRCG